MHFAGTPWGPGESAPAGPPQAKFPPPGQASGRIVTSPMAVLAAFLVLGLLILWALILRRTS